jgi:hypothetical protein
MATARVQRAASQPARLPNSVLVNNVKILTALMVN